MTFLSTNPTFPCDVNHLSLEKSGLRFDRKASIPSAKDAVVPAASIKVCSCLRWIIFVLLSCCWDFWECCDVCKSVGNLFVLFSVCLFRGSFFDCLFVCVCVSVCVIVCMFICLFVYLFICLLYIDF